MSDFEAVHSNRSCTIEAEDPGVRIEVLDGNLKTVPLPCDLGAVTIELAPGVYVIRFHKSGKFVEQLATVSPGEGELFIRFDRSRSTELQFASAAPVYGTTTHHEWQSEPAAKLSRQPARALPKLKVGGAQLVLFDRDPGKGILRAPQTSITVRTLRGRLLFDLAKGQIENQQQWRGVHLELDPGLYLLRRRMADGTRLDQVVPVCHDWQTQVFLMTETVPGLPSPAPGISILMAKPHEGFDPYREDLRWTESALSALATPGTRGGLSASVEREMLTGKFQNPMLGIYAALLHLRRDEIRVGLMNAVFTNLCKLVGPLPDVLAIGWELARRSAGDITAERLQGEFESFQHLAAPPMLQESEKLINRADWFFSKGQINLVPPGSIADRIEEGAFQIGGWLCWNRLRAVDTSALAADRISFPRNAKKLHAADELALPRLLMGGTMDLFRESRATVRSLLSKDANLRLLARQIADTPGIDQWLRTRTFTRNERAIAYWLCPELDPQFGKLSRVNESIARSFERQRESRLADGLTSLAEPLGLSSRATARITLRLMAKLFVRRALPSHARLDRIKSAIARRAPDKDSAARALDSADVPLSHPVLPRKLKLLEAKYLLDSNSDAADLTVVKKAYKTGLKSLPKRLRDALKASSKLK